MEQKLDNTTAQHDAKLLPVKQSVMCCGNKSKTRNAGLALCIVNLYDVRKMTDQDTGAACIENAPGRMAHLLRDWRYFSRKFPFAKQYTSGSFQSIFQIRIPDDVTISSVAEVTVNNQAAWNMFTTPTGLSCGYRWDDEIQDYRIKLFSSMPKGYYYSAVNEAGLHFESVIQPNLQVPGQLSH